MPEPRCHVCWNFLDYCECVARIRSQNSHPSTVSDPLFMLAAIELDAEMTYAILQLMSGGLAYDRDTWIKRQTENLDDELRDLLP